MGWPVGDQICDELHCCRYYRRYHRIRFLTCISPLHRPRGSATDNWNGLALSVTSATGNNVATGGLDQICGV